MPYAFVQQTENSGSGTGVTTFSAAPFGSNPTAANLFWYVIYYNAATEQTAAFADTLTNSPTEIGHLFDAPSQTGVRWGYVKNILGGSADTPKANFGGTVTFPAIYVAEYSGLDTTAPFTTGEFSENPQSAPGSGSNNLTSGNTPTLAAQPALQVGFSVDNTNPNGATAGSAFTARTGVWTFGGTLGADLGIPEDRRLTATTAAAALFNCIAGTHDFFTITAVFKEPGGATPTFPPVPAIGLIDQRNNPVFRM